MPILPQNVALADIKVDGSGALVVSENGFHNVVLSKTGEYVINASFSLKSSLEKGPYRLDMGIRNTPITLLRLEIPLKDVDVEISQAQQISTNRRGNTTVVSAVISPGRSINIVWRKKTEITEKIPAKLYSELHHLISIEDDVFKINSDINYNILHSEVDAVQLVIPLNMNVLSVLGEGVGEWQETEQEDQRTILIPFTYGKKGSVRVRISTETPLSETGLANAFSGIRTLDSVRETGFIGIELNTSAEVIVAVSEGLEKMAVQKLPQTLINKSVKPLILGFKYLKHPYTLVLDIKKHEKIGVPVATINSASIVTLFTEDGKVVHRLVYQVRTSAKQFLEIHLPENADVWSVFVGNQPVESSLNGLGKLLIPLNRSRSVNNQLDTFPVEVIYCMVENGFSLFGSQKSSLPAVDLLISQLIWSVYLRSDYSYYYFSSTLEKEEIIRGLNVFSGAKRRYDENAMREVMDADQLMDAEAPESRMSQMKKLYSGKDYKSSFRNVPMKEEELSSQVANELKFGGRLEGLVGQSEPQAIITGNVRGSGVLPIQIHVPTGGQVYRFAKTIIKTEDQLAFSVIYTRMWINNMLKWIIYIFLILIIYLNIKRKTKPWRWISEKSATIVKFFKKHENVLKKSAQSIVTPFVLVFLMFVFSPVSRFLTVCFFILFGCSLVNQIIQYRRKIIKEKKIPKKTA